MSLTVKQSALYRNDTWEWAVWIDGPPDELAGVESVTYVLHPTFPNPIRLVTDRSRGFRLEEVGWGGFTLHVQVKLKDGELQELAHELLLTKASTESVANHAQRSVPLRVVISHSAADEEIAERARMVLLQGGMNVVDPIATLRAGEPWDAAVDRAIRESDLVVPIVTASSGRWVDREIQTAVTAGVPLLFVAVNDEALPPSSSELLQRSAAVNISRRDMSLFSELTSKARAAVNGRRSLQSR